MKSADELQQLANICEERGDYAKAARLHAKALAFKEMTAPEDDPDLAPFLYNLGMINCAIDLKQEAEKQFNRLLNLLMQYFPEEHADVMEVKLILQDLYYDDEVSVIPFAVTA